MNVIHIKETYVHLWATPFYVEGLTMVPMLGQLIVLTVGGRRTVCSCCICGSMVSSCYLRNSTLVHSFECMCPCMLSRFSHARLFVTLRIAAHQAPQSVGFYSKNTGVGYHALFQGIFLALTSNPHLLHVLHCNGPFTAEPPGKPFECVLSIEKKFTSP